MQVQERAWELQQALARAKILAMGLEVRSQLIDSFGEERNLNGRATGVCGMAFEPLNLCFFNFLG